MSAIRFSHGPTSGQAESPYALDNIKHFTQLGFCFLFFSKNSILKEIIDKYNTDCIDNEYMVWHCCVEMMLTEGEEKQLITWENLCAGDYLRNTKAAEENSMENQVKLTSDR